MFNESQGARVCVRTPKHRFTSDGAGSACAAIFKTQADPVTAKPYGTRF